MSDDLNTLILGLIGGSPFANAEFLLRSQTNTIGIGHSLLQAEADLTHPHYSFGNTKGQVIYIKGIVRSAKNYHPLERVTVEIFQKSLVRQSHGETELNYGKRKGRCLTDKNGEYLFKSLLPVETLSDGNELESRHILFKVSSPGLESLTTKMYFSDAHELTKNDKGKRDGGEDHSVVKFYRPDFSSGFESHSFIVYFPIILSHGQ